MMLKNISFKKISNRIIFVFLCFSIILSSCLCGSPLNHNTIIVNLLLNITAMISIVLNQFILKKKIMFSKFDIIIFFLSFLYLIPICFHTYCSMSDTLNYFLRYISIFCVYLIIKNLALSPKAVSILLHSILLGAILVILIGIDDMSTQFCAKLHTLFHTYTSSSSSPIRLDSVFEYPNALATFINFSCFLTLGLFLKSENKYQKGFYVAMINIQMIGLILTGSRLSLAIFLFIFLFFLLLLRDKQKIIDLLGAFLIVFFTSLFYCNKYLDFINSQQFFFVWGFLLLIFLFVIPIYLLLHKWNNKVTLFSFKKFFIVIGITIATIFITLLLLLQIPDSLTLFNEKTSSSKPVIKQLNHITPNTEYLFEFNIDATPIQYSQGKKDYSIIIFELNENFEDISTHYIKFNEYNGWKSYQLTTLPNTKYMKIACQVSVISSDTQLTIHDFYLNHKKVFLNYKFLPSNIVFRIANILSGDNSLQERFTFIKDGIKIGMQHFFTGSGANGWKYNFENVQEEKYYTTEVHSYPTQLFIEVGFGGVILYFFLMILIGTIFWHHYKAKTLDITLLSLFCSILTIFFHSLIDFDMSFFCILLQFYTIIFLIEIMYGKEKPSCFERNRIFTIGISIVLIILLFYTLRFNIGIQLSNQLSNYDQSFSSLALAEKCLKLDPYNKKARLLKVSNLNSTDLIKEFELFIHYEPSYANIDSIKLSYVMTLLTSIDENNYDTILNKITEIRYSDDFLSQYNFKQNVENVLEMIQKKKKQYPNLNFNSISEQYSAFLIKH